MKQQRRNNKWPAAGFVLLASVSLWRPGICYADAAPAQEVSGAPAAVTGWHWIDGYCYYFYGDGHMASNEMTPDGYLVSESGAWTKDGHAVYMAGKGILTKPVSLPGAVSHSGGGSGSGGSGGGSGSSGSGSSRSGSSSPGSSTGAIGTDDSSPDINSETNSLSEQKEENPDERLQYWEELAMAADFLITGTDNSLDSDHRVHNKAENDRRIKNLVSQIHDAEYHEFYMIGMDYQPNTLILGQMFREQLIYSNTQTDVFSVNGAVCTVARIRVQKIPNDNENTNETKPEEKLPSLNDYYSYGDTIVRKIGNESYVFKCIDEDYQDQSGNYRKAALFLCDSVIRADVDSSSEERNLLSFGSDNNYKNSTIRKWLKQHTLASQFPDEPVCIGVNQAFGGSTGDDSLVSYAIPYQQMNEGLFILSVEEALGYEEELWCFEGSDEANPESQYSSWSKGYYLRSPMYETDDDDSFCYGTGVYIADLIEGCIRPVDVSFTSIGIRPVFAIPNG